MIRWYFCARNGLKLKNKRYAMARAQERTGAERKGYMRKKYLGYRKRLLNLQFFAEGDGAGADKGDTGTDQPQTFDEILGNKNYQAEFDRRVQKALETQRSKLETLMNEKATEAEKLALMTKEEKDRYLHQKRVKDLETKEASITKRELVAEAKVALSDQGLPVSLAEVLSYSDADTCKASIEAVGKAFQEAVEAAVEEKLKGGKPPKKAPDEEPITKEQFAKMGYAERLKLKTEQPELYKQFSGK